MVDCAALNGGDFSHRFVSGRQANRQATARQSLGSTAARDGPTTRALAAQPSAVHLRPLISGIRKAALLYARTLGELRLENSNGDAVPIRRKPLALLCYVARHAARPTSRTELATLFWGERGEDRARQSLRQTLLELKQAIGDRAEIDAESVRITPGSVELDLASFERAVAAGEFSVAVDHWKGDFFEGTEDVGGDGFRRWIENERAALHRQLSSAMQRLLGDAEIRGDWTAAVSIAERWTAALRFDETAHLRLIEALKMSGRTSVAATVHSAYATRLRTTLDVEPSAEFLRLGGGLADDMRAEIARRGKGSAAVHAPPLVGRGLEFGELLTAWQTVSSGTPVVMLVQGESGTGLTRIGEELIAHLGNSATVLRGRATGDNAPYSAASMLFEGIRDAEGSAGASPEALAEVARLVPSLKLDFKHLPEPRGDAASLRDGLAQTLAAIGEERPVLLFLDDAHRADEMSRRTVGMLASRLAGRVLFVVTIDEAAHGPNAELGRLTETLGLKRLWLHSLGLSDIEAIVGSMVSLGADERHRLATLLFEDTGGLPHHVTALITALVHDHLLTVDQDGQWRLSPALAGRPLPVPTALRDRVRAKFARLTPDAAAVAGTIAVLGAPSSLPVIEDVVELSPDAVEAAIAELLDQRAIVESSSQPEHYEFASPLIARTLATLLPPTKRRALHARAAEVLVQRDMTATAERSLLPYHLARAESQPSVEASLPGQKPVWMRRSVVAGAAALAIVVLVVTNAVRFPFRPALSGSPGAVPVVALGRIADYRAPGSPDLTKPLIDMLATNLGRVSGLRVVSTARMYELVSQGARGSDTTAAVLSAARRAGANELVDGALYTVAGGGMRLDLRRMELATGNMRKSHSVNGATLFELADSGTARLAADFGQYAPLGSVADVTTRSLPAYHLYEQGLRAYYASDKRSAERLFEAALVEDSTFAMAAYYSGLSVLESRAVALQRFNRAARLARNATDRERLIILARQASAITSSPSLGALADTLTTKYPDEVEGYLFTGFSLLSAGDFLGALTPFRRVVSMDSLALTGARPLCNACDALRQIVSAYQLADSLGAAERELRRWIRIQPESPVPWHTLADVLEQQGRPNDAIEALQHEAVLDPTGLGSDRVATLALQAIYAVDFDDAERLLRRTIATGSAPSRRTALWYLVLTLRHEGRLAEALEAAKQYRQESASLNARAPNTPRDAMYTQAVAEAQVLFEMRRFREAAALFDSIARWEAADEQPSQLARSRAWGMTHAASALGAAGDTGALSARADSVLLLGSRSGYGRDQRLHHHVRGLLFAARGRDDAAADELRRAIYSMNMGYTRTNLSLASVLMRQRKWAEAIAVLQPVLRGPLEASNYYATRTEAHDQLAQAWDSVPGAAARDSAAAHYAVVAKSWARADPIFADRVARARGTKN
jgi:DNA-binding SARP family transcriptional activator